MLDDSSKQILSRLESDQLVLDVGGWAKPFPRADWVIDLMPYSSRGLYGSEPDPAQESFSAETWVQRDICDRDPWPFAEKQFDFVVCAHTLEDVRDPVWVCSELIRVAKAGYIEVPSRLEEQTFGVEGPWVGWGHHHWLVDISANRIEFVFKHQVLHGRSRYRFPPRLWPTLSAEEKVETLWWEGSFDYGERVLIGSEQVDDYLGDFVERERRRRPEAREERRRKALFRRRHRA